MIRSLAFIVALFSSAAAFADAAAGHVLAVRNQQLVWLTAPTQGEPNSRSGDWEEWNADPQVTVEKDGSLFITHRADLGPIMVEFRLAQEPDGQIEIEMELQTSSGTRIAGRAYSASNYASIADRVLISRDRLCHVLAPLADGQAPQDVDLLIARRSAATAPVSALALERIASLGSADWRTREAAAAKLADPALLPELRTALATMDLSDDQRRQVECLVACPKASVALLAAIEPMLAAVEP
jgi:hypothetical protein